MCLVHHFDIVGYAYEGDEYCLDCAHEMGIDTNDDDVDVDEVHPLIAGDEWYDFDNHGCQQRNCMGCLEVLDSLHPPDVCENPDKIIFQEPVDTEKGCYEDA